MRHHAKYLRIRFCLRIDLNLYGWNACRGTTTGSHPTQRCSQQWVRFNTDEPPPGYKRLACHELAHSVGMQHRNATSTCVHGAIYNIQTSKLDSHDVDVINGFY